MPATIHKPYLEEYPEVYQEYIQKLPEEEILYLLEKQGGEVQHLFQLISDARAEESYAAGKWTMKEVLQHLIDSERVFAYRALCFSRGEKKSLPAFDENMYAYNSLANIRLLEDMLVEYNLVRKTNLCLFRSFTAEMLDQVGEANGNRLTVRALIHILAAHELHHLKVLKERYLTRQE